MGQLLVRNVDDETIARLKARAAAHGRSMEAELREVLRAALHASPAPDPWAEFERLSDISLTMTAGRPASAAPAEELQRETREEH